MGRGFLTTVIVVSVLVVSPKAEHGISPVPYLSAESGNVFNKFDYFQELKKESTEVDLGVFEAIVGSENGGQIVYDIRHVPIFFPTSIPTAPACIFGAALALHDFNNNISTVIPSVGHETDACPNLKLTTTVFDTEMSPRVGSIIVSQLLRLYPTRDVDDTIDASYPTAIIGAILSSVSSAMAILAGVKGVPMISPASFSAALDNKGVYPTFGRVLAPDRGDAEALISFLSEVLNVTHLGVLFRRDQLGISYAQSVKQAALSLNPPMVVTLSPFNPGAPNQALQVLKDSGFRYFFGIIFPSDFSDIMTKAYEYNITGPGYGWIFGPSMYDIKPMTVPSNSSVVKAIFGSAIITPTLPHSYEKTTQFEEYERHWADAAHLNLTANYLHSLLPSAVRDLYPEIAEYLGYAKGIPPFMYEAAMAIALAACRSHHNYGSSFSGQHLFNEFLNVSFEGINGFVSFDKKTGSRDHRTLTYSISAIIAETNDDGNARFRFSGAYVYEVPDPEERFKRKWTPLENTTFLFSDNTTTPPESLPPSGLRTIPIQGWARNLGLVLSATTLLLSVFFSAWTALFRKTKVVMASQPVFLHMLCSGTFITGLAILPLSFQNQLSAACMITPWLISGGVVIAFSAVLSKLKRVNTIFGAMSHRRIVVTTTDVLRPFRILFVLNVSVLTGWTVLDPLKHEMRYTDATDRFGRPIETYGRCINYNPSAQYLVFAILWAAILIAVIIWANIEAYKARSIATEYSESQHLAKSMALILQAALMGVPLLFVVDALPTFWYLVETSLLFIVCMSVLLPIFVPKMMYLKQWRSENARRESRKSVKLQKWADMKARVESMSTTIS